MITEKGARRSTHDIYMDTAESFIEGEGARGGFARGIGTGNGGGMESGPKEIVG